LALCSPDVEDNEYQKGKYFNDYIFPSDKDHSLGFDNFNDEYLTSKIHHIVNAKSHRFTPEQIKL
jgi:hypothetical protein